MLNPADIAQRFVPRNRKRVHISKAFKVFIVSPNANKKPAQKLQPAPYRLFRCAVKQLIIRAPNKKPKHP